MSVKYQIFVSSTYEDLRAERDQVIRAVLEMGHIPVGMEMFSAADEEQWRIIARQIDQSDYYVVITAHRYGSLTPDGVSYTEKEYDYAVQQGVPTLGFVLDASAAWPADLIDTDVTRRIALDAFKEKVKKKPVGFWTSADELHAKVSIALMKQFTSHPRPGWIRSTDAPGMEIMAELSRLSSENARLRKELETSARQAEEDVATRRRKLINELNAIEVRVSLWFVGATAWDDSTRITLLDLFVLIAPELVIEKSVADLASYVATMYRKGKAVRSNWPVPSNTVKVWLADLMQFGLTAPSSRKHPVSDKGEYWTLTSEGREMLILLRKYALEAKKKTEDLPSVSEADQPGTVTVSGEAAGVGTSKNGRKKAPGSAG